MEEEDDKYSCHENYRLDIIKTCNSDVENISKIGIIQESRDDLSSIQNSLFDIEGMSYIDVTTLKTESQVSNLSDISSRVQNFMKNKRSSRGGCEFPCIQDDDMDILETESDNSSFTDLSSRVQNYMKNKRRSRGRRKIPNIQDDDSDSDSLSFRIQNFINKRRCSRSVDNGNISFTQEERVSIDNKENLIKGVFKWVKHTNDLSITSLRESLDQDDCCKIIFNEHAMGAMNLLQYVARNPSAKQHISKYFAKNEILIENDEDSIFLSDILGECSSNSL